MPTWKGNFGPLIACDISYTQTQTRAQKIPVACHVNLVFTLYFPPTFSPWGKCHNCHGAIVAMYLSKDMRVF